jgi:hypothetical protein
VNCLTFSRSSIELILRKRRRKQYRYTCIQECRHGRTYVSRFHATLLETCTTTDEIPVRSVKTPVFSDIFTHHCIIHQQAPRAKANALKHMVYVTQKENCKLNTLAHCASSNIWSQAYANYVGSVLLTAVAWSCGRRFLFRIQELLSTV